MPANNPIDQPSIENVIGDFLVAKQTREDTWALTSGISSLLLSLPTGIFSGMKLFISEYSDTADTLVLVLYTMTVSFLAFAGFYWLGKYIAGQTTPKLAGRDGINYVLDEVVLKLIVKKIARERLEIDVKKNPKEIDRLVQIVYNQIRHDFGKDVKEEISEETKTEESDSLLTLPMPA